MPFARGAGENHVAGRPDAGGTNCLECLNEDRHARNIVGNAPAVNAAGGDGAGKRIVRPMLRAGQRLAVGMPEKDHAPATAGALQACDDAGALA